MRRNSNGFYSGWITTSAVTVMTVIFAVVLYGEQSWVATVGLMTLLVLLLLGGLALLIVGIKDAIRDFLRYLHARSESNGHLRP